MFEIKAKYFSLDPVQQVMGRELGSHAASRPNSALIKGFEGLV